MLRSARIVVNKILLCCSGCQLRALLAVEHQTLQPRPLPLNIPLVNRFIAIALFVTCSGWHGGAQFHIHLTLSREACCAHIHHPGRAQAELRVLAGGKVKHVSVELSTPARLVPVHIKNRPPSYFIFAGLVFTQARRFAGQLVQALCMSRHRFTDQGLQSKLPMPVITVPSMVIERACQANTCNPTAQVTVPFLRSEYGKDYDYEAPVKLLDAMMHAQADSRDQQARCPWAVDQASELRAKNEHALVCASCDSCLRLCSTGGIVPLMPMPVLACALICGIHAQECMLFLKIVVRLAGLEPTGPCAAGAGGGAGAGAGR